MSETKKDLIFIFSASTGGGHNAAARSLQTGLIKKGYDVKVIDAFGETPALNKVVTKGYQGLVDKLPKLYHTFYYHWDKQTKNQKRFFNAITYIMNPEILPMIYEEKPVLLISTHPFVTKKLSTLKAKGAFNIPILSFVTDYKIHGFYISPQVDAYVVGSEYTKKDMVARGMPADIIYPFGIPLRAEFQGQDQVKEKEEPKDTDVRGTILMMAGSLGSSQMEKAFSAVMKVNEPIRVIVVCGKNESMARDLKFLTKVYDDDTKKVEIYGFVDNVDELMDISDVIVTKPGGITTTEAIVKGIPMLIPYYYPGQEEDNVDFVVDSGIGIKIDKIKDLTSMIEFLIQNQYILWEMSKNMSETAAERSEKNTLNLCDNLIAQYKESDKYDVFTEPKNWLYNLIEK